MSITRTSPKRMLSSQVSPPSTDVKRPSPTAFSPQPMKPLLRSSNHIAFVSESPQGPATSRHDISPVLVSDSDVVELSSGSAVLVEPSGSPVDVEPSPVSLLSSPEPPPPSSSLPGSQAVSKRKLVENDEGGQSWHLVREEPARARPDHAIH